MAKVYKLHKKYRSLAVLVTNNREGKAVNLTGKPATKEHKASEGLAAWEEEIPAATQDDLKFVYESGAKDEKGHLIVVEEEDVKGGSISISSGVSPKAEDGKKK